MKKLTYAITMIALLLAGCSQEENLNEKVQITFTASMSTGVQSRNGTSSTSVDKMICAVCSQTGEGENAVLNEILYSEEVDVNEQGMATFTPSLLKGYKYGIVFWAYKEGTAYYDATSLNAIEFKPNANDNKSHSAEGMEAYTATIKNISTSTSGNVNVTLHRPLSQINVATTSADWANVKKLGETPTASVLTLEGCSNVYNALQETFSGNVTFTYNTILSGATTLEQTDKILLGRGYTFPNTTVTCKISVNNSSGTPIYELEVPNVKASKNYRTNLVPSAAGNTNGGLMTGNVSYTIQIENGYTTTENEI